VKWYTSITTYHKTASQEKRTKPNIHPSFKPEVQGIEDRFDVCENGKRSYHGYIVFGKAWVGGKE